MPRKLSRRPLKRWIQFEVQLAPYSVAFRDGNERPRVHYVIWTSQLPKGKKSSRSIAVLQKMTRPGRYSDLVHNPVLYQRIVVLPDSMKAEGVAKGALNACRCKAYWLLKDELARATRPVVRTRGGPGTEWETFEPGMAGTTPLEEWRKETLWRTANVWLGHWDKYEPFGYMNELEPKTQCGAQQ
jgi:hypothetical protein